MNRDDIIRMAREAGFKPRHNAPREWWMLTEDIERFAALVAAAEREACAKVCESLEIPQTVVGVHPDYLIGKHMAVSQCATAIRERMK